MTLSAATVDGKKGKIISIFVPDDNLAVITYIKLNSPILVGNDTAVTSGSFKEAVLNKLSINYIQDI